MVLSVLSTSTSAPHNVRIYLKVHHRNTPSQSANSRASLAGRRTQFAVHSFGFTAYLSFCPRALVRCGPLMLKRNKNTQLPKATNIGRPFGILPCTRLDFGSNGDFTCIDAGIRRPRLSISYSPDLRNEFVICRRVNTKLNNYENPRLCASALQRIIILCKIMMLSQRLPAILVIPDKNENTKEVIRLRQVRLLPINCSSCMHSCAPRSEMRYKSERLRLYC